MPDKMRIGWLVWESVVLFLVGFAPFIAGAVRKRWFYHKNPKGYFVSKFSFTTHLLFLTIAVLIATWLSRYVVAYYSSFVEAGLVIPCNEIGRLEHGGKEWVNSFLHALQTFSMDEDYTEYWLNGQAMIRYLTNDTPAAEFFYNLYMALLNVLAPILGGAIVFEMLTKAFPSIRLFFSNFKIWREKYYFSELNENSIALARSILSDSTRRDAALVFTNVSTDDDEEKAKWLLEAKTMGAICLKSDLLHIAFNKRNRKGLSIFLIDKEENNNVGTLAEMLKADKVSIYKKAHIYVFSSDRKYSRIEDEVSRVVDIEIECLNRLKQATKSNEKKAFEIPYIRPVNIVKHTADTLMQDIPLFEPLIGRDRKELRVTILGGGSIGTEMFLAVYHFGQILNVQLHINVISLEDEESEDLKKRGFNNKINYINPEILRSADEEDDLLRYDCGASVPEKSPPYMHYRYFKADVMSDDFLSVLNENPQLLDTDYLIVTLGNDEDNFTVADKWRTILGRYHLMEKPNHKTVIAYSIYNSDLSDKLNEIEQRNYVHNNSDSGEKAEADIFMHAFGCKDEVYSCNNVFFEGIRESALSTEKNYQERMKKTPRQIRQEDEARENKEHKKIMESKNIYDIYNYLSSLARSMHIKYKIFSAGLYSSDDSVFSKHYNRDEREQKHRQRLEQYKDGIIENHTSGSDTISLLHQLAWLEHRRWCAFMRTCGFQFVSTEDMKKYYLLETFEHKKRDHKYLPLKLHPCLVECSQSGILIALDEKGHAADGYVEGFSEDRIREFEEHHLEKFDRLDYLSYYKRSLRDLNDPEDNENNYYDFKKWDYPAEEKIK